MMNPEDFIQTASAYAAMGRDGAEPHLRNAVSRAYYGAFHLAKTFLAEIGHPTGKNHADVTRWLTGSKQPAARKIGDMLGDLQADRVAADYKLHDKRFATFEAAQIRILLADQIRLNLDECRQEPLRSEIEAAIGAYKAKFHA